MSDEERFLDELPELAQRALDHTANEQDAEVFWDREILAAGVIELRQLVLKLQTALQLTQNELLSTAMRESADGHRRNTASTQPAGPEMKKINIRLIARVLDRTGRFEAEHEIGMAHGDTYESLSDEMERLLRGLADAWAETSTEYLAEHARRPRPAEGGKRHDRPGTGNR